MLEAMSSFSASLTTTAFWPTSTSEAVLAVDATTWTMGVMSRVMEITPFSPVSAAVAVTSR